MPVRELFHLMGVVDDFDAAAAFFEALFSPLTVMPRSWSDLDKRVASIGMIGPDLPWEPMEPSKRPEDAEAPLVKFQARFGEHFHSMAWFVDEGDLAELVKRMQEHGIRVVGPDGTPVGDDVPSVVFTHGRDTCGQLEFMAIGAGGPPMRYPSFTGD